MNSKCGSKGNGWFWSIGFVGGIVAISLLIAMRGYAEERKMIWAIVDDFSGPFSATCEEGQKAIVMFLEERNYKIGPFKIEVVTRDTELKPAVGVRRLQEVINEYKPFLVSSGGSSGVQLAMQDVIAKAKGPIFWTEGGSTDLTTSKGNRYSFRWASPTYAIAKSAVGEFLKQFPKLKKIIQIQMDYAYGYDMAKFTEEVAKENGVTVVKTLYVPATATDLSTFITEAKASGADAAILGFYGKLQAVGLNQAYEFKLGQKMKIMNFYASLPTLRGVTPDALKGVYLADEWFPGMPNKWSKSFTEKYHKKYGSYPSNYAAQKYIECELMEKVLVETKSDNPKVVIQALEKIRTFEGPTGNETMAGWQHQIHHDYLFLRGKDLKEKRFSDDFVELVRGTNAHAKQGATGFEFDRTKESF